MLCTDPDFRLTMHYSMGDDAWNICSCILLCCIVLHYILLSCMVIYCILFNDVVWATIGWSNVEIPAKWQRLGNQALNRQALSRWCGVRRSFLPRLRRSRRINMLFSMCVGHCFREALDWQAATYGAHRRSPEEKWRVKTYRRHVLKNNTKQVNCRWPNGSNSQFKHSVALLKAKIDSYLGSRLKQTVARITAITNSYLNKKILNQRAVVVVIQKNTD